MVFFNECIFFFCSSFHFLQVCDWHSLHFSQGCDLHSVLVYEACEEATGVVPPDMLSNVSISNIQRYPTNDPLALSYTFCEWTRDLPLHSG